MLRIGFVVEGRAGEVFLRENVCPWLKEKGITAKIINAGARSRLIRDAPKHLNALRRKGCKWIFFVLDQEMDQCPPATAKKLEAVRTRPDVKVCVAARTLEAWLLADPEAIKRLTGQVYSVSQTDKLDDPKGKLKELFFKKFKRSFTEVEMVKVISRHFSLERAAERNLSAKRFLRKLEDLLREPA